VSGTAAERAVDEQQVGGFVHAATVPRAWVLVIGGAVNTTFAATR
jgi:hypothetical protein